MMAWMLNRSGRNDRGRLLMAQLLRATSFAKTPSDLLRPRNERSSRSKVPLANDRYRQREAEADQVRLEGNESRQRESLMVLRRGLWQGEREKGRLLADTPVSTLRQIPVDPGTAGFSLAYAIHLPRTNTVFLPNGGPRNVTWSYLSICMPLQQE